MNTRTLIGALSLGGAVLLSPRLEAAQEGRTDPRWLPWIGCWAPVEIADSSADDAEPRYGAVLCVIPAAEPSAVEILTVEDGAVTARARVNASGEALATEREGCRGTETTDWSPDGVRVYLRSEYTCGSDATRRASGLMVITPGGDWLDIRELASGRQRGLRVARYEMASPAGDRLPAEVVQALDAPALENAPSRDIAGGIITTAQVIEASARLDTRVVEAWLAESFWRGPPVSGEELVEMSGAGVPASVTDLVVALSYPKRFALDRPARQADELVSEPETYHEGAGGGGGWYPFYWPSAYYRGNSSYYGYGWYPGGVPVVIVVSGAKTPEEHGQVVKGQGYKKGSSSSSSTSSSTNRRTESSSSSSSSESSSNSSSSSSSSERTAHPRP